MSALGQVDFPAAVTGQKITIGIADSNYAISIVAANGKPAKISSIVTGARQFDYGVNAAGLFEIFDVTSGRQSFSINASDQAQAYEPSFSVAAMKNVATSTSNVGFTGALTGMTAGVPCPCSYSRTGNIGVIKVSNASAVTGTSNTTAMTLTGLPAEIATLSNVSGVCIGLVDNGVAQLGTFQISGGVVTFALGTSLTGAFTASGTKGLSTFLTLVFPLT
jgi:hypothetical protein